MKHLTLFQNRSEFDAFKNDEFFELPNVSFIVDENKVIYSYLDGIILETGNYYPELAIKLKEIADKYSEELNNDRISINATYFVAEELNDLGGVITTMPLLQEEIDYLKSLKIGYNYDNLDHYYVNGDYYITLIANGHFNLRLSDGYLYIPSPM